MKKTIFIMMIAFLGVGSTYGQDSALYMPEPEEVLKWYQQMRIESWAVNDGVNNSLAMKLLDTVTFTRPELAYLESALKTIDPRGHENTNQNLLGMYAYGIYTLKNYITRYHECFTKVEDTPLVWYLIADKAVKKKW